MPTIFLQTTPAIQAVWKDVVNPNLPPSVDNRAVQESFHITKLFTLVGGATTKHLHNTTFGKAALIADRALI